MPAGFLSEKQVAAYGRFAGELSPTEVEYVAAQLEVADPSRVKRYVERPKTAREHGWEIRAEHGYRIFDERDVVEQFGRFLDGRAWTQSEGQVALFEHAVAWLRRNRILLPRVTVLERRVGSARREEAEARLYREVTPRRGPMIGNCRHGRLSCWSCRTAGGSRGWS